MSHIDTPDEDALTPGTAGTPRLVKAGCGIRFEEGELSEGIAFDGVEKLRPDPDRQPGDPDEA